MPVVQAKMSTTADFTAQVVLCKIYEVYVYDKLLILLCATTF